MPVCHDQYQKAFRLSPDETHLQNDADRLSRSMKAELEVNKDAELIGNERYRYSRVVDLPRPEFKPVASQMKLEVVKIMADLKAQGAPDLVVKFAQYNLTRLNLLLDTPVALTYRSVLSTLSAFSRLMTVAWDFKMYRLSKIENGQSKEWLEILSKHESEALENQTVGLPDQYLLTPLMMAGRFMSSHFRSHGSYEEIFMREVLENSKNQGYRDHSAEFLTYLPNLILFPTFRDLGVEHIVSSLAESVQFLGLTSRPVWADGRLMDPFQFLIHDFDHTMLMRAITESKMVHKILPALSGESEKKRRAVILLIFDYIHEDYNLFVTESDLGQLVAKISKPVNRGASGYYNDQIEYVMKLKGYASQIKGLNRSDFKDAESWLTEFLARLRSSGRAQRALLLQKPEHLFLDRGNS